MLNPTTEQLDEHLRILVAAGCVVQVDGSLVFPVAYAEAGHDAVFFVAMPGATQQHVHSVNFVKAEIHHGRDVLLRNPAGAMVAYFAPYKEFREHDPASFEADWQNWLDFISVPENEESFMRFVEGEKRGLYS